MTNSPENVLKTWLYLSGIAVSGRLLNDLVKGHPDYPSLLSITETMDYLGIESMAAEISKDMLHEVQTPFLTCYGAENDRFVIVTDRDTIGKTYPGFFDTWNGVVITLQKNAGWKQDENSQLLRTERDRKNKIAAGLIILTGIIAVAMIYASGWKSIALMTLAVAGVFVSWFILSGELGVNNALAEKICGSKADCHAVSQSKAATLFWGIKWSDVGVIWFSALLTALVLSCFTGLDMAVVSLISLLTPGVIPFLLFSLYYQWRIVKKWCRLCLVTAVLLAFQLLLLLPVFLEQPWLNVEANAMLLFGAVSLTVAYLWFSARHLLEENKNIQEESWKAARFRRNEAVFSAMLDAQPSTDAVIWENELLMGNPAASLQVMVACNPYCRPCASLHAMLHDFISRKEEQACVAVRFALDAKNKEDKRTKAAIYLLSVINERIQGISGRDKSACIAEVLHQWFSIMDLEKFRKKYPANCSDDAGLLLQRHAYWAATSKISYTPAVFINGKEVPVLYDKKDMLWQLIVLAGKDTDTSYAPETEGVLAEEEI